MKRFFKQLAENSYLFRFFVWSCLHNFVDLAAILLPVRMRARSKPRVILTRLDSIGDYLIWTSTFDLLTKIYPPSHFELFLVGNKSWGDFATKAPIFEETILIERSRFVVDLRYRFRIMRRVRSMHADVIINPTLSRDFLWSDSIVRCSAAKTKVGSYGLANRMVKIQQLICNSWYTTLIQGPVEQHELVSNDDFARALCAESLDKAVIPLPKIYAVEESPLRPPEPYAAFFLDAQFGYKRWPVDRFAKAAELVSRKFGLNIVIGGGPGQEALGKGFEELTKLSITNLVSKTSLPQAAGLIKNASLVVTNDTSICHVSTALAKPTVVINPGAHPGRFFPYPTEVTHVKHTSVVHQMPCFGCDWKCIYTELTRDDPKPCITGVSVDQVMEAVENLLNPKQHIVPIQDSVTIQK